MNPSGGNDSPAGVAMDEHLRSITRIGRTQRNRPHFTSGPISFQVYEWTNQLLGVSEARVFSSRQRGLAICAAMEEFTVVENYLRHGRYPEGLSKGEKANLRRKCRKNFLFKDGILYYKRAVGCEDEQWRVCIGTNEEKEKIMESCHAGVEG